MSTETQLSEINSTLHSMGEVLKKIDMDVETLTDKFERTKEEVIEHRMLIRESSHRIKEAAEELKQYRSVVNGKIVLAKAEAIQESIRSTKIWLYGLSTVYLIGILGAVAKIILS